MPRNDQLQGSSSTDWWIHNTHTWLGEQSIAILERSWRHSLEGRESHVTQGEPSGVFLSNVLARSIQPAQPITHLREWQLMFFIKKCLWRDGLGKGCKQSPHGPLTKFCVAAYIAPNLPHFLLHSQLELGPIGLAFIFYSYSLLCNK